MLHSLRMFEFLNFMIIPSYVISDGNFSEPFLVETRIRMLREITSNNKLLYTTKDDAAHFLSLMEKFPWDRWQTWNCETDRTIVLHFFFPDIELEDVRCVHSVYGDGKISFATSGHSELKEMKDYVVDDQGEILRRLCDVEFGRSYQRKRLLVLRQCEDDHFEDVVSHGVWVLKKR